MINTPWLSPDEVADLCEGLTQPAAQTNIQATVCGPDGSLKFLSREKLKELTGYKQAAAITRSLQKKGIPFFPRPSGWPGVPAHLLEEIERGDEIPIASQRLEFNRQLARNVGRVYRGAGVYALLVAGDVVYIGQTTNVIRRIGEHAATKEFDEYRFIRCDVELLAQLERKLIRHYRPAWNISQNQDWSGEAIQSNARAGIEIE